MTHDQNGRSMPTAITRTAAVVTAALLMVLTLAGVAAAHVTVSSQDAAPGGYGKLTFRVPNESDTASTVAVRIQVPEEAAMGSLQAQPVPGWTVTTTRTELPEPIDVHGQRLTEYVSLVEFTAGDGGGIRPGQFQEFALSGGPFPDAETVSYPTIQVYSDGNEAAWIEPTLDGEEPESPAPTLDLAAQGAPAVDEAAASTPAADEGSDGTATAALVLAVLGLVAGVAGLALGWSARRRTVSS
jgi:periplasmic copper chaperone A